MNIRVLKVLRLVSKIILLVVALGIVGYGGFLMYKSIINKPHEVRVTNITSSAFSVSWITDSPSAGVVYYGDTDSFLPGPLSWIGKKSAVDDRDYARAQNVCVSEINENANKNKDADFTVDVNGFDCENIVVKDHGKYYTHHVTLKNLDSEKDYYFRVGDGLYSSKGDVSNSKTFSILKEIKEPSPIFGRVVQEDGNYASDSIVYVKFNNGRDKKVSQYYSSVTNDNGGWYMDGNYIRTDSGELVGMERAQDSFEANVQYKNYKLGEVYKWIYGYFSIPYPDMTVKEVVREALNPSVFRSLAVEENIVAENILGVTNSLDGVVLGDTEDVCSYGNLDPCSDDELIANQEEWGYGNVARELAKKHNNGVIDEGVLEDMGLSGDATTITGNLCAIAGSCAITAKEVSQAENKAYIKNGRVVAGSTTKDCVHNGVNYANGSPRDNYTCKDGVWVKNTKANCANCCEARMGVFYSDGSTYDGRTCDSGTWIVPPKFTNGEDGDEDGDAKCLGDNDIVCTDDDGKTILLGQSCPKLGGTCQLNGSCSGVGASCTLTPKYTETEGVRSCLPTSNACTLKCAGETTKVLNSTDCTKLGANRCVTNNTAQPSELKFEAIDLNKADLKLLITVEPAVRKFVLSEINQIEEKYNSGVNCPNYIGGAEEKEYRKWCAAVNGTVTLGGDLVPCDGNVSKYKFNCDIPQSSLIIESSLISKAYAEESTSSGYTLYLPEYGMYSFELGDYQLTTSTTNGNTYHIFYIEANDKAGFQMPTDPDNPTVYEDIVIKSASSVITYEKVASAQTYTLSKGINIISFNLVPVSQTTSSSTAQDIIIQAKQKGVEIEYITTFEGGRWSSGYSCSSDTCSGDNFTIIPGRGYLVYVTEGGEITIPGYNLKTPIPVNFSGGWNLVGVNGYTKAYTASSFIESINTVKGLTANNVTWWPTSKGIYEGLQVTGEQQYGFDFPISPTNGYFVRISSFKPEDSKCKSLLWNEGGTLNGACGVIK